MSICPKHGPYTHTCRQCTEDAEKALRRPESPVAMKAPKIEDSDKYLLRSFEAEFLQSQLELRDAQQKAVTAQQALNRMAGTIFEKLGLDHKEWILDTKAMTLVKREEQPSK
jgi:hypothetical protein